MCADRHQHEWLRHGRDDEHGDETRAVQREVVLHRQVGAGEQRERQAQPGQGARAAEELVAEGDP